MIVVPAPDLQRLLTDVFAASGCPDGEAHRVAESLVDASLTGHDSHGVVRTQRYVQWIGAGVQHAGRSVTTVLDGDVFVVLEGNHGMGQTLGPEAVRIGVERAARHGVSIVALRHAGHLGRIGEWAEMAAAAGLVSIHLVNVSSSRMVAPFGGIDRRMATNPVCIGVPCGAERPPVVLDFATSVVAEGKALVALNGGKPLPEGALIDGDGHLTTDPRALYGPVEPGKAPTGIGGTGALRAMGEHKGSGLSVMCELLAGALTGSGAAGPGVQPFCNGMLSIYLSPDALTGGQADQFHREVIDYVDWLRAARPAVGVDEVLAPGDPERAKRAANLEHGLELPDDTWTSIVDAAAAVGVHVTSTAPLTWSRS